MAKMTRAALFAGATLPVFALLGACSLDMGEEAPSAQPPADLGAFSPSRARIMAPTPPVSEPEREALSNSSPRANVQLKYYGGPMISNVKVQVIFWGSNVDNQNTITSFYSTITQSEYIDWLSEYNTQNQTIGRGSLLGAYTDTSPPATSHLSDAQIQGEITKLIKAGKIPPADGDMLYMIHFPPGVSITMGGAKSCQQFCAYHGTYTLNGQNVYYGVMPDLGACGGGCGNGTKAQNTTTVSSHELIEAITDPAIGLVDQAGPPLAWYNLQYGEIGDICNGMRSSWAGFSVQKEFSNEVGDCITTKPGGGGGGGGGGGSSSSSSSASSSASSSSSGSGGGGSCAHDICTPGATLDASCEACVTSICKVDPYCCSSTWDRTCVGEVQSVCNRSCP